MDATPSSDILATLGHWLRQARIANRQSMAAFALQIGVGESTVRAMERGSPAVRIGAWMDALVALGLDSRDVPSIERGLSRLGLVSTTPHHRARKRAPRQHRATKRRSADLADE